MLYGEKNIILKTGEPAVFRSPRAGDGAEMAAYLKTCATETEFILRTPEECTETPEKEAAFLTALNDSDTNMMIVCTVNGVIAGNCQLIMNHRVKTRHRASVAIAILREYWNRGIGTAMFREMEHTARAHGVEQLELEYIEGNERAAALYRKAGFREVASLPDAIRLSDGGPRKLIFMFKEL